LNATCYQQTEARHPVYQKYIGVRAIGLAGRGESIFGLHRDRVGDMQETEAMKHEI